MKSATNSPWDSTPSQVRYLIIQSDYGLCNRLMALASYAPIAEYTNRQLRINWTADELVGGCEFADLFENDLGIADIYRLKVGDSLRGLHLSYGIEDGVESDLALINRIPEYPERVVGVTMSCYFEPDFIDTAEYHASLRRFLLGLRPVAPIRQSIADFCERHRITPDNGKLLGLHIRRTDGQREPHLSTDRQFESIVEKHLQADPEVRFFLATDCGVTEDRFRQRFPGVIITSAKRYQPDSPRGTAMDQAMLDLYVLASTHFIYGSYGSSFSKVAAILRGCDFHQVGLD